jgi:tetratricopeptide (TPR) repeat protein
MRERFTRAARLLARAKELEPDNPRVLWVAGGELLFKPAAVGGNPARAVELYRRAVDLAPAPARSPLPDWGKAESLMALAYAHLNYEPHDLGAARAEAHEALRLEPDWSYMRDILLPQIEAAAKVR